MLQYTDDTMIVLKGELAAVEELKSILDKFSDATGLGINFSKSTLVPIHMDQQMLACYNNALKSYGSTAVTTMH